MECENVLYIVVSANGCFNEIWVPDSLWVLQKSSDGYFALSNLSKALLSLLILIGCTSRGAAFVV